MLAPLVASFPACCRCCEKSLGVLRQHQEALLTILQVLLYDPLCNWTLSPEKAFLLQQRREDTSAGDLTDLDGPAVPGQ